MVFVMIREIYRQIYLAQKNHWLVFSYMLKPRDIDRKHSIMSMSACHLIVQAYQIQPQTGNFILPLLALRSHAWMTISSAQMSA